MPLKGAWFRIWIYLGFVCGWTKGARPRFDTSTDMGLVLVPADAEIESVIFRLRATDQDADFPLTFDIAAAITPVVRIDNLPCTLYNKVCQANVVLTRRLIPGRLHDFAVRVRDSKGDSNSMQATISVTNATTPRDTIFPHIPSLIMVPENTKPGTELDYLLVRSNQWSGKPVYIELWELFTIRQRQTPSQTRGIITLIGELDFETQSMYTLTMYATDPYTEPGKDTRNIAGLNVVVIVQDVQDVPPIFTLAPPLTKINNSIQPGDVVLRVHAEDGDKGVPREITYGLVSEGNPFTPFFNISETTGEIILARPLEELTKITHVGAPIVLSVVAEEIRRVRDEPPAQATVVEVGLLLGEPGNSPPYFESDKYMVTIDENLEPGTIIKFPDAYSTRVRDEDIGKAGVFALKLDNNNGTFEITPTVAERTADFIITVRDNTLIDYELHHVLTFEIRAQEVGPATNLSTSVPVTIFIRDVNDNSPIFDEESYEATLSENVTAGTRVVQVHASDKDTGVFGSVKYTGILGEGSKAFAIDPDTGLITVAMGSSLDRETTAQLQLSVEARDENGKGNRGVVPLIVNLLDVNDNAPIFEKDNYEFMLNSDLTNFTTPAFIKASDADAEEPNNIVRYELIQGNYENKFYLNEVTGELVLRSPITKIRRKKQSIHESNSVKEAKAFKSSKGADTRRVVPLNESLIINSTTELSQPGIIQPIVPNQQDGIAKNRRKRAEEDDTLYILTARAYDLGVPHLHSETQIRIIRLTAMESRIVMFVVPGEHPDIAKTTRTLTTITGGDVTVMEIRPYVPQNYSGHTGNIPEGDKKSIVIARVNQKGTSSLVDIDKIREALAANGVGILNGMDGIMNTDHPTNGYPSSTSNNNTAINNQDVTLYRAENKLLFWLLIILGLLILLALAILIICCICPGCPFYMEPRKRRIHSSETLVVRADGRPRRHLHRKHPNLVNNKKKEAWSADPTRRNWQFNRRNTRQHGLASLPGDVVHISGQANEMKLRAESFRLRDGYDGPRRREEEVLYIEDVEGQKIDLDSLRRHELERGSDDHRQTYRYTDRERREDAEMREQHFYREGNAEVLRLVTRGEIEETGMIQSHLRHPVVDGKDILLQRFMEDQKMRHENAMHDIEAARSMESHQRAKDTMAKQTEIIIMPERLDIEHRQHLEEVGPSVQRLLIDHSSYAGSRHEQDMSETQREAVASGIPPGVFHAKGKPSTVTMEQTQSTANAPYTYHDIELIRHNALLTRLLLEKEARVVGAALIDAASYLETQSLPGQVAIATQTDRTASTQTERHNRSRSDNDESDDDSRFKRKYRSKKRIGDYDSKRTRAFWMKSPIEEEENPTFDQKLNYLRKKFEEVKCAKKLSLEPAVLREISDSLDGNGSSHSCREDEESTKKMYKISKEQANSRYRRLRDDTIDWRSSVGTAGGKYDSADRETDTNIDVNGSTSSPETYGKHESEAYATSVAKSPKKICKLKSGQKQGSEPSFRILEKEITLLAKKLSKFGDKKNVEGNAKDIRVHEKDASKKEFKKETVKKTSKKRHHMHCAEVKQTEKSILPDRTTAQDKDATLAKARHKLKYQHTPVISTGSSEYDETFEKRKKQAPAESTKQKQVIPPAKVKKPTQAEKSDQKKIAEHDNDGKKTSYKEYKVDAKSEKTVRELCKIRPQKLAVVGRREHVKEESESKTYSDRTETKKENSFDRSSKHTIRKSKKVQEQINAKTESMEEQFIEARKENKMHSKDKAEKQEEKPKEKLALDIETVARTITDNIVQAAVGEVREEESAISLKEMLMNFAIVEQGKQSAESDVGVVKEQLVDNAEPRFESEKLVGDSSKKAEKAILIKQAAFDRGSTEDDVTMNQLNRERSIKVIKEKNEEADELIIKSTSIQINMVVGKDLSTSKEGNLVSVTTDSDKIKKEDAIDDKDILEKKSVSPIGHKDGISVELVEPVESSVDDKKKIDTETDNLTAISSSLSAKENVTELDTSIPHIEIKRETAKSTNDQINEKEDTKGEGDIDEEIDLSGEKIAKSKSPVRQTFQIEIDKSEADMKLPDIKPIEALEADIANASISSEETDLTHIAPPDTVQSELMKIEASTDGTKKISESEKLDEKEGIKSEPSEIIKDEVKSADILLSGAASISTKIMSKEVENLTMSENLSHDTEDDELKEIFKNELNAEENLLKSLKVTKPLAFIDDYVDKSDEAYGMRYIDVELPPYACAITAGLKSSEDSDSSSSSEISDISGKTALKIAPYQTPRHSPRERTAEHEEIEYAELKSDDTKESAESEDQISSIEDTEIERKDVEIERVDDVNIGSKGHSPATKADMDPASVDEKLSRENAIKDSIRVMDTVVSMSKEAAVLVGMEASKTADVNGKGKQGEIRSSDAKVDAKRSEISESNEKAIESDKQTTKTLKERTSKSDSVSEKVKESIDKGKGTLQNINEEKSGERQGAGTSQQSRHEARKTKSEASERKKSQEHARQRKKKVEDQQKQQPSVKGKTERDKKTWGSRSISPSKIGPDIDTSKTQSKYMAWYKQKREEMEKRRMELRRNEDEEQLPRWLRRSLSYKKAIRNEQKKKSKTPDTTPRTGRKVKPLVNVESEQLKAIVRQGRKLRKAEGKAEDPSIEIFASSPPEHKDHHLIQHSEYKYEKMPVPFYLHPPPPPPHPSPQLSPELCESQAMECRRPDDDLDSGIAVSLQGGNRLRHQQLLEKKSVFDIAYSEAAPSQLRADSTTPPS
ncbi:cadherin-86C [Prorops nasuta]|uniref:cadherin-86C n=1 Tax=Prorops nasuta TaxID=863751 RepID=UPI0034CFB105